MSLVREYRNQFAWRGWKTALDALPPLEGKLVLDLGCGVGDLATELVARGARVARLKTLQSFCGAEFESLRADFLACLSKADHRSRCRVVCVVAAR